MLHDEYAKVLKEIASKPTMEKLIQHLKELNFEFVDAELIKKMEDRVVFIPTWTNKYSYLVRRYVDGNKSRLDFDLMIGVHFVGVRMAKYLVFVDKNFVQSYPKPWDKPFEFNQRKKKVLLKFPDELDIEERKVWRKYHDWWKKGRTMTPEQMAWYLKFKPMIKNLDKEFDHLE